LDRLDRGLLGDEARLELLPATQVRDARGNLHTAEVGPLEADTVISGRGLQREGDFLTGMKADTGALDGSTECALSRNGHPLLPQTPKQSTCQNHDAAEILP